MRLQTFLMSALLGVGAGLALRRAVRAGRRMDFGAKVVVITGGSRGLGLVMARQLVAEGAHVVLLARNQDELERARQELERAASGSVTIRTCDVRSRDEITGAIAETVDRFGRVDVLINNAGVIQVGPFEHMTRDDFQDAMDTHLWAPLYAMQAAVPHMARRRVGRIVNISSVGGRVGVPHMAPYAASKFALVGLSDALRAELRSMGIRVTTVCPWLMRTGSHVNARFKGRHDAEFAWFAISASVPSMNERRAARRILEAARYGDAELNLGLATRLAMIVHVLAPELMGDLLALTNRLLPSRTGASGDESRTGAECRRSSPPPSLLTARADRAVESNNENLASH